MLLLAQQQHPLAAAAAALQLCKPHQGSQHSSSI
jgi:hypothetical protein